LAPSSLMKRKLEHKLLLLVVKIITYLCLHFQYILNKSAKTAPYSWIVARLKAFIWLFLVYDCCHFCWLVCIWRTFHLNLTEAHGFSLYSFHFDVKRSLWICLQMLLTDLTLCWRLYWRLRWLTVPKIFSHSLQIRSNMMRGSI